MTVDPTQGRDSISDKNFDSFINVGTRKTAVRVNDATVATNVLAVTGETITVAAGAQGTTGVTKTDKAPIYNATGTHIGEVGDTGFAFVTGTVLTTEVKYRFDQTDTVQLAALGNGEYAIDYDTGRIRYCKDTAATSDTANYGSRMLNVDITGIEDIQIGAVEIKDGDSDTRMDVITQDAAFGTATNGLAMFGKYQATPTTYSDNDAAPVLLDANGRIVLASDIQIGAVELKDGDSDTRADIHTDNTAAFGAGLSVVPGHYLATPATITDTYTSPILLGSKAQVLTNIYDGTTTLALTTGTTKTIPVSINDGTTMAEVLASTHDALKTAITDGTNIAAVGTGTTKALLASLHDGTTLITFGTGTTKNVPVGLNDGTTGITFGTGTVKTVPCAINDGTTTAVVDTTSTGLLTTQRQNVTALAPAALDLTAVAEGDRTFTSTFSKAWEISRIQILFSTAQARDITISNYDGTNLFTERTETADTSLTYVYPAAYNWFGTATDEIRIVFAQTGGACTATIRVIYRDA